MSIKQIGTQKIETDRIILRRFKVSDAKDVFEHYASDEEVTKFLTWKTHENLDVTKAILSEWVKKYANDDFYSWAIYNLDSGEVIGAISLKTTPERFRGEIGFVLGKAYWNKGIMTEALKEILKYGFERIGLSRIQAAHHIMNKASGKVMLKAGMKHEGRLRKWSPNNEGVLVDCMMYSIIN